MKINYTHTKKEKEEAHADLKTKAIRDAESSLASKSEAHALEDSDSANDNQIQLDGSVLRLKIYRGLGFEPVLDADGRATKMLAPPPTFPQPSRLTTHRAEAPGQASSRAAPSQPTICCSGTNARISAVLARVIEQCPTSTANTATACEVRRRMIRETMEHLRMDHNCQHTT
ncbi:hypothetical protein AZE42_10935 [Rhizopogon vesiculosus]|uniref:Kinetochore protein Spc24 n=1 Tax=Rhizopogon vesiculosus TaxID=180088 RepID=A0A1J8R1P6_9AGAM|nr:hypothetical protein AZE42_10935 [Rhizopogon vesiculosus]